jgi:hypothetical protein
LGPIVKRISCAVHRHNYCNLGTVSGLTAVAQGKKFSQNSKFKGASGIQLARQGFGEGSAHLSEFLFFILLWLSEATWIVLVILVGIGYVFV